MVKRSAKKPPPRQAIDVRLERQQLQARKLKRDLRLTKSIARMTRELERAVQSADRSLREFVRFVHERDGDGDVLQLEQLALLLQSQGELRHSETIFEAVRRLVHALPGAATPFEGATGSAAAADGGH